MTISRKISLSFLVSAVVLTAASVTFFYTISSEQLKKELFARLSVTAQSRAHHVDTFLGEHVSHAELRAVDDTFIALLVAREAYAGLDLPPGSAGGGSGDISQHIPDIKEEKQRALPAQGGEYLRTWGAADRRIEAMLEKDDHILGLSILDTAGIGVASSIEGVVGTTLRSDEVFTSGKKAAHVKDVHIFSASGKPVMTMSAPVFVDGRFLGVIVQHLQVDPLYKILMDRTGLGETGEAYLVNRGGYMISPSRFVEDAVLKQKVESDNLACCLLHMSEEHPSDCSQIAGFTDYRGVEVLGTHEYIPAMDWCLLVEIDSREALVPLRRLKSVASMLLVAIPLVALLIGIYVSRVITAPIKELHKGARIIGKGDLSYRVGAAARDEIGDLGREFDEMAEGLGKATTTIDRLNEEMEERERAQRALRESRDLFERTLRSLPSAVFVTDVEKVRILNCNPAATEIFGYSPEEMLGRTTDFLHVDDSALEEFRKHLYSAIEKRGYLDQFEFRMKRKDGTVFPTEHGVRPLEDEYGNRIGWVSVVSDITERKRAEEALARERDRAQKYLDVAEVIIMASDIRRRVTSINRKGCEVLGLREDEIVGLDWCGNFVPADVAPAVRERFERFVAQGTQPSEYSEHLILTKDGGNRLIAWHSTLLRNERGEIIGVLSSGEDITDRRKAEQEVVRLERLKALGGMAAGVSHNLNNILVGVLGHAQLLEGLTRDPEVLEEARAIVKSARRAENLVDRLTLAVKGEDEELGPVDMVEVVKDVVEAKRSLWRDESVDRAGRIDIVSELGELPLVCATSSGLVQIFNNLLENAAEAMSNGGRMMISADEGDGVVRVMVADSGIGMREKVQSRILEPFFTTKAEVGKGLGLSTVYGLLTRWGGGIDVDSKLECGTTVTITLPCWRKTQTPGFGGRPGSTTKLRSSRRGRVLIVDDEEIVSRALRDFLSKRHEVNVVENARQALEALVPGRFDVVLMDLGLPGMPGDVLAARVRERDKDLVTVLMTGWSIGAGDPRVAPFDFLLRKPFGSLSEVDDVVVRSLELREERLGRVEGSSESRSSI